MNEEKVPLEIERKFLIKMPDAGRLLAEPGAYCDSICQTYLRAEEGGSARVRCRIHGDTVTYTETRKRRVSALTQEERERQISPKEYRDLLKEADPRRRPIRKKRYCIPYEGRLLEIDVYPFWNKTATLEIELPAEDAPYRIPDYLQVIREVSAEKNYKNSQLAVCVPPEPTDL